MVALLSLMWLSPALASLKDLANCDPLRKDMRCPPDAAFAGKASFDFTTSSWDNGLLAFWSVDNGTAEDRKRLDLDTNGRGAAMGMWKAGDAPTLVSTKYLLFGKVSVTVQAAEGPGLVTAMVLKSDSGDEIDWELLGAYANQAQTNYFYDGQALFNTYNDTYALDTSSFAAPQTYAVEWTDQFLSFSVNGAVRKTWYVGQIPADKWPRTPMQVKLGVWAVGGDGGSDPGEVAWAGGLPDWAGGPYKAYFGRVDVEDYAGFCNATDGQVEYQYDERTAGWQDVRIAGCRSRPGARLPTPSPVSSAATAPGPDPSTATATATATAPAREEGEASLARVPSPLVLALGLACVWAL
ncbi:uncharacterized protein UV8b_07378 [Ustilaginoidea virens]|uniref:GH16 domain-containing protein n=1 Tax=Ustilaginoidea virens TaxID=1159556 RepID=A0A1B5L665_USTVR|nr:uncharacterized protein UV8b_07378 [Ustilaginoidea virens]QUC23137.1 hypothetical protein UV8b_07378 [Ustilaginoidea virens]GAO19079.1 hypothetical protein UVI_02063010 [Ustilaginoidea virens]